MTKILIDEATVKLALEALRSMANTLAEHQEPTTFYEDEAMRALEALAAQPAQQSAVRGEPNHVEDVLAMVEPKIGCVNHDCDKCKAASERKTYYGDRIILGQGDEPNIVIPEGMKDYTPQAQQGPVGYVLFEGDDVQWTDDPPESGTLLFTTPQAQPAPEIAIADAYRAGFDSGIAAEKEACAQGFGESPANALTIRKGGVA